MIASKACLFSSATYISTFNSELEAEGTLDANALTMEFEMATFSIFQLNYSVLLSNQKDMTQAALICWMYMLLAILLEVVATIFMKYTGGFTKVLPTVLVFICYAGTFPLFILALKKIPVSVAYPTWAGIGTLLIFLAGMAFFQESISAIKILSALLILLGVIGLNL